MCNPWRLSKRKGEKGPIGHLDEARGEGREKELENTLTASSGTKQGNP